MNRPPRRRSKRYLNERERHDATEAPSRGLTAAVGRQRLPPHPLSVLRAGPREGAVSINSTMPPTPQKQAHQNSSCALAALRVLEQKTSG